MHSNKINKIENQSMILSHINRKLEYKFMT